MLYIQHFDAYVIIISYLRMMLYYTVVNSQVQEMNMFQQSLVDLERMQQLIKKQYEPYNTIYQ